MVLFAELTPEQIAEAAAMEAAVRSSVESLGRIFLVVIALAIGEAFKQFVSDKAEEPEDRQLHWDRMWALVAFVALVVPFSHGMARYFFDVYQVNRPRPYAPYLLGDSIIFTIESVLFFVLSRCLPRIQWRRFCKTVLVLLILDIAWGSFASLDHAPELRKWVYVNMVGVFLLGLVLVIWRKPESLTGMMLATFLIVARTVADYVVSFRFYFPPQP